MAHIVLGSEVRENGSVVVTVGRRDLAQAVCVLTPAARGEASTVEIYELLYEPGALNALVISRRQQAKREGNSGG